MNIYIAARFSKRPECNKLSAYLKTLGHNITSRWVLPESDHVKRTGLSKQAEDSARRRFAVEDIEDIENCGWMISFMEEPRNDSRGGRHVEFGYALALGKKLTILGPRETVFHHLENVEHFESVESFVLHLHEENKLNMGDMFSPLDSIGCIKMRT